MSSPNKIIENKSRKSPNSKLQNAFKDFTTSLDYISAVVGYVGFFRFARYVEGGDCIIYMTYIGPSKNPAGNISISPDAECFTFPRLGSLSHADWINQANRVILSMCWWADHIIKREMLSADNL